ncbi:MAG: hypothetical protein RL226_1763 [Bacteroidota bacterium]
MNYTEVVFTLFPVEPAREVLIADLSDSDAESFVETDNGLIAYFPREFDSFSLEGLMVSAMPDVQVEVKVNSIERQNWNATWEASFQPIIVSDSLAVVAPFHEPSGCVLDLVIQPKMSFGTGHHDTTFLMLKHMLEMDFTGKIVLDMGSGTGVLALLAEKRGAKVIDAIDIDDWSTENCKENMELNSCSLVSPIQGDANAIQRNYDVVLANINRNVLLADMPVYISHLNQHGALLLSGFFVSDREVLVERATSLGLRFVGADARNDWSTLWFEKL